MDILFIKPSGPIDWLMENSGQELIGINNGQNSRVEKIPSWLS